MYLTKKPLASHAINECFAHVENALAVVLETREVPVAAATLDHLQALIELTQKLEQLQQAAQSLHSFLENLVDRIPVAGDYLQIAVLLDSIRRVLRPWEGSALNDVILLRKVAFSGPRPNQPVCLFLDSKATGLLLENALVAAGYGVQTICGLQEVVVSSANPLPAAIIADLSMLRADPAACENMQRLREIQPEAHLFCLSSTTDFASRLEAVRLGATRFLAKPLDLEKLLAILDGVTARKETEPFRVLLIDDDRSLTTLYAHALSAAGLHVETCNDPLLASASVSAGNPDVIVSDVYMPGCNGLELAAVLRQDETLADTPILFLSTESDVYRQIEALDLGGDDFLTKPVNLEVLCGAVIARAKRARMLKRIRREQADLLAKLCQITDSPGA